MSVTTIVKKVSASADDGRNINGNGNASIVVTTQHLGKFGTTDYWNGFRWTGVNVPQGENILSATLDLYSAQTAAGSAALVRFYGEDANTAAAFGTATLTKPEGRTRTTAYTDVTFDPADWLAGLGYGVETIDVTAIVQEIIDRAGWASGNALAIVAHDNGSADDNYVAHSTYDRDTARGASLTIIYGTATAPAVPTDLAVVNDNEYRNRVTWTDPNADATSFEVQRKTGAGGTYATIATLAGNHNWFMDTTAAASTEYFYKVRTINLGGTSAYATEVSVTTMGGTGDWTTKVQGWLYPDSAISPEVEFSDGRRIHTLKAEYYRVDSAGVLEFLVASPEMPYAYSATNVQQLKDAVGITGTTFVTVAGSYTNFQALLDDTTKQTNMINTLVDFVVDNEMTGVELDWEQFASWNDARYAAYKTFCTNLKTALNAESKLLMVDAPPISNATEAGYYKWKYEEVIDCVDFIAVMAYDYQYDYGGGVPVAPTVWVQNICDYVMPRVGWDNLDKLIVAMNSYGYQAAVDSYSVTILTQYQAASKPGYNTATEHPDAPENGWVNGGIYYSYVTAAQMDEKRKIIEDKGIKTVSVWHLGGNNWFTGAREEIDGAAEPIDPFPPDGDNPDPTEGLPIGIYRYDGTNWTTDLMPEPPAGITDHGQLAGLGDDDHPQYMQKSGATMTGALDMNSQAIYDVLDPLYGNWVGDRDYNDARYQAALVSATNIKTVNGVSLLGSGDIVISGSGVTDHGALTGLADDDHTQYHTDARGDARYTAIAHATDTANPHAVTKSQVGLGSVDNTADTAKPVSTAQQTALDLKAPLASPAFTGTPTGITKSHVGLGNVDNTSNATERAATRTLTNARITARVGTTTSSATPTINTDDVDAYSITALAAAITSFTTNLSGTPTDFQKLTIRIKDNGTARAIAWGASFEAKGVALPTTTTVSKVTTVGFIYDTVAAKWGCVAAVTEA